LLKLILIFFFTTTTWGYRLTSDFLNCFYWSELPINITVLDNDPTRKAMLEDLSKVAIEEWQSRSGLSLWDYSGAATKNIIRWSTNFAKETKMDPESTLAVAIRYTKGPYFAKTEIVINGGHALNQNQSYLRTTLTHELGKKMGLYHSDGDQAVRAPTLQAW